MADSVLIVMTSGPDTPRRCATPFFYATLARAMDYDAAMFFTIDGPLLLKKGVAEKVYPKAGGKPVSGFLQDARQAGVRFIVCTAAMELHDMQPSDLIQDVETGGGATMWQLADKSKAVLTF